MKIAPKFKFDLDYKVSPKVIIIALSVVLCALLLVVAVRNIPREISLLEYDNFLQSRSIQSAEISGEKLVFHAGGKNYYVLKDSINLNELAQTVAIKAPSEYGEGVTAKAIDDMLERLQLDYLDCVYLHHPAGDYMAAYHDLEEAYRQGKVRAIGISNFDNWMDAFDQVMEESEIKPQIMQIECHPFAQRLETRALAEQYDMQVECWYPLGHADDRLLNDEVLSEIAQVYGKSVVQIILRWHMQEGLCAVPGSTNPDHIQENIEIFDFELSDEEMEQIRAIDKGEEGRYFNINYEQMGGFFTQLAE